MFFNDSSKSKVSISKSKPICLKEHLFTGIHEDFEHTRTMIKNPKKRLGSITKELTKSTNIEDKVILYRTESIIMPNNKENFGK